MNQDANFSLLTGVSGWLVQSSRDYVWRTPGAGRKGEAEAETRSAAGEFRADGGGQEWGGGGGALSMGREKYRTLIAVTDPASLSGGEK